MLNHWIKDLVERRAFGVCQYLGDKMRVSPAIVRHYFIYTSFISSFKEMAFIASLLFETFAYVHFGFWFYDF